ncbi:Leucine-rich repeat [Arabidopsis suecica]|uniref:Leucine-rich repeat n=1 Tax=Arabidopsis suecica TaxID=45249 RepID=A0A8T2DNL8_ARASU|nr:Leucine-rich repeat [Arabidopsis suecica]
MNCCWQVVEPCYKSALSYLCVKVGNICMLKENLVLLKSAFDELKAEKEDVVNRVNAGELKGGQRLAIVATWLSQVEIIEENTKQLMDVASARDASSQNASAVRRRLSTSGCWFSTCNLGEKVFKKLTEVKSLSGKDFQEVTEQPPPPVVEVRLCQQTVGLDTTLEKTWESLRKDENRMLGIFGMGGVGKTTLLTLINNKFVEVSDDYDVVIWVESSKDADVGKIQDAIGERLHICDNNWSTYSRGKKASEISRVLRDMKPRFVLLLDDLWEDVSLTAIGIPVLGKKYKVVFTTRSKDVCSVMRANEDIEVQCLSENDAWDLFDMKVHCDGLNEISDIAKKIVAKCCGLPLALEVIRKTMASKSTVIQWRRALDTLESYPSEMKGTEKGIFQVLKLSYDYLKTKNAKCFLYCALFPKAYYIKQDELVEYWIGEGFIDEKDGRERAKDRGYEIIDNLVGAGLLLESNKKVYMHDMIRDMALWIVSEFRDGERYVVKTDAGLSQLPDVTDWTTVTKMSLFNNEIKNIPDDPEFPDQTNLVTLFLQNNRLVDIVGKFFLVMSTLVVLDLSWNFQITELPKGISALVSLRLLNLSGTSIKHLPEGLGVLSKLIHLNLESTSNLRSVGLISELQKLQVLRFYGSAAALDCCLLKILEQLKGLQLLTVTVNNDSVLEEFLGSTRLAGMTQGLYLEGLKVPYAAIGTLSSLHKLEMVNCDITESGTEWEGKRRDQYSPSTSSSEITPSNPWFKDLSAVVINSCIHLKDLTWPMYAANLESLSVESSPKMTELINKEKAQGVGVDPFQELQVLRLHYLKELGSIYGSQVSFPKLKLNKVDIENCPNLHQRPL